MGTRARNALLAGIAIVSSGSFANPAHEQLQRLSEAERAKFFSRYFASQGESCRSVTKTMYQGSSRDGAAFYSVQCSPGKAWQVMINNDRGGSARFVDCSLLAAVNAGKCFTPFK